MKKLYIITVGVLVVSGLTFYLSSYYYKSHLKSKPIIVIKKVPIPGKQTGTLENHQNGNPYTCTPHSAKSGFSAAMICMSPDDSIEIDCSSTTAPDIGIQYWC